MKTIEAYNISGIYISVTKTARDQYIINHPFHSDETNGPTRSTTAIGKWRKDELVRAYRIEISAHILDIPSEIIALFDGEWTRNRAEAIAQLIKMREYAK